jgi:hypothetical protein
MGTLPFEDLEFPPLPLSVPNLSVGWLVEFMPLLSAQHPAGPDG